jgi:hypothetical protein
MPPETPATPSPAEAMSDFAETQALIAQITAEARAEGVSLGTEPGEGEEAPAPTKGKPKAAEPKPQEKTDEDQDDGQAEDQPEGDAKGDEEQQQEPVREVSLETISGNAQAIVAALKAEGAVDIVALAEALGVTPEQLGVSPATHAAIRANQRKAKAMVDKALDLGKRLNETYGDQAAARKAAENGELEPAIEFCERTFGMPWNELNRMVAQLLQGKPVKDLAQKRELYELKKKEAAREAEQKKASAEKARAQKEADAKAWIASSIKGDKLASPDLEKQLSEAGFPTITDLVFEEMKAGYAKGLTDPRRALEKVKAKLTKQARALQNTGLLGGPVKTAPKAKPLTQSTKPRANAQTGAAGNGRPMSDAELREAVLKEHGLWRQP